MKVMVIGGGGREYAIVKKLLLNKTIEKLYVLPSNGGINRLAEGVDIKATDLDGIVNFAVQNKIDYAVVAQDDPLVLGLVDRLNEKGIDCFGPTKDAAIIEGSKVFAKSFMKKHGIPTADYRAFDNAEAALKYLANADYPIVIKADGVAAGKGVTIANDFIQAKQAVLTVMNEKVFGSSGDKIVIEEYLRGTEFTLLAFCDGNTIKPMISSMDHKKALDGDMGLNTGGMGAIAPSPVYDNKTEEETLQNIVYPTLAALKKEGIVFKGCLYFGLILTDKGVKVVEYNSRFGDPEAQAVLPLMKSDLLTVMTATTNGTLDKTEVKFNDKFSCCVIMASKGYPVKYEKGYEIKINEDVEPYIYYAGVKQSDGALFTNGGRVLGVIAVEDSFDKAIEKAYERVVKVEFENMIYRKDIGKIALRKNGDK